MDAAASHVAARGFRAIDPDSALRVLSAGCRGEEAQVSSSRTQVCCYGRQAEQGEKKPKLGSTLTVAADLLCGVLQTRGGGEARQERRR